jgi:hypothetical protein
MSKWYWPTWPDWLKAYGEDVTNYAYKGYCNNQMYWQILDKLKQFDNNDHIIIVWPRPDRQVTWYDREWIDKNDVKGFFPDTQGKLWLTKNTPYTGLYRKHPEHLSSFTDVVINGFDIILQTQLLLDRVGCKYTMAFVQNPWADTRPEYAPKFATKWQNSNGLTKSEIKTAKNILEIDAVRNTINLIDWSTFISAPEDPFNINHYAGIWEYYFNKKECVIYKHKTDNHITSLAHHDWAVENLLDADHNLRGLARDISKDAMTIDIPQFTREDFVAPPETELLLSRYKDKL